MAITINGSGTITGLSAGGLPDGSVTAGDLESTLDLTGKSVTLPSGVGGKVVAYQTYTNSIRQVTSSSQNYVLLDFNITKTSSSTLWIIDGLFSTWGHSSNGGSYMYLEIDGSRNYTGVVRPYDGATDSHGFFIKQLRSGISAGSRNIKIGWSAADSSSNKLVNVLNPDASDDSRNRATGSVITFYEVAV
jgi:hypothetical protein